MKWFILIVVVALAGAAAYAHMPEPRLPADVRADKVLVLKSERKLVLVSAGRALKEYRVALGRNPLGHKTEEGDGRTPKGEYLIDCRKADSSYHRALRKAPD